MTDCPSRTSTALIALPGSAALTAAKIARAVDRHREVTGDGDLDVECGLEILGGLHRRREGPQRRSYERIIVRGSSLSACTQAVMCAEVGHLELAHDYAWEAALVDLRDLRYLHANTRDRLRMASMAGTWSTIVEGFGGLRERAGVLSLAPRLSEGITQIRFRLQHDGLRTSR